MTTLEVNMYSVIKKTPRSGDLLRRYVATSQSNSESLALLSSSSHFYGSALTISKYMKC